jgi:hypothetical protein
MILIYTATVTPFKVCFLEDEPIHFVVLDFIIDFLFALDIAITCFLAYFDKNNKLVVDKKKIFLNYLTGWMLLDLFA